LPPHHVRMRQNRARRGELPVVPRPSVSTGAGPAEIARNRLAFLEFRQLRNESVTLVSSAPGWISPQHA
jgi:hypothetical protein